ncbi:MAG: Fic family protein, partial [Mycobacterium sp.]|nr:Fic family protein [Mycobacterium sp.]
MEESKLSATSMVWIGYDAAVEAEEAEDAASRGGEILYGDILALNAARDAQAGGRGHFRNNHVFGHCLGGVVASYAGLNERLNNEIRTVTLLGIGKTGVPMKHASEFGSNVEVYVAASAHDPATRRRDRTPGAAGFDPAMDSWGGKRIEAEPDMAHVGKRDIHNMYYDWADKDAGERTPSLANLGRIPTHPERVTFEKHRTIVEQPGHEPTMVDPAAVRPEWLEDPADEHPEPADNCAYRCAKKLSKMYRRKFHIAAKLNPDGSVAAKALFVAANSACHFVSYDDVYKVLNDKDTPDGYCFILASAWADGSGGHEFLAYKEDGEVKSWDPENGEGRFPPPWWFESFEVGATVGGLLDDKGEPVVRLRDPTTQLADAEVIPDVTGAGANGDDGEGGEAGEPAPNDPPALYTLLNLDTDDPGDSEPRQDPVQRFAPSHDIPARYTLLNLKHNTIHGLSELHDRYDGVLAAIIGARMPELASEVAARLAEQVVDSARSLVIPRAGDSTTEWLSAAIDPVRYREALRGMLDAALAALDAADLPRGYVSDLSRTLSSATTDELARVGRLLPAAERLYYQALVDNLTVDEAAQRLHTTADDVGAHWRGIAVQIAEHLAHKATRDSLERDALERLFGGNTQLLERAEMLLRRHFPYAARALEAGEPTDGTAMYTAREMLRFLSFADLPDHAHWDAFGLWPLGWRQVLVWLEARNPDSLREARRWLRIEHPGLAEFFDLHYTDIEEPDAIDLGLDAIERRFHRPQASVSPFVNEAAGLIRDKCFELLGIAPRREDSISLEPEAELGEEEPAGTPIPYRRASELAEILSRAGFSVEVWPPFPGRWQAPLRIDGEIYDYDELSTVMSGMVAIGISMTLRNSPVKRILVDMRESTIGVSPQQIREILSSRPVWGLQDVIVINRDGRAERVYSADPAQTARRAAELESFIADLEARLELDTPAKRAVEASLLIDARYLTVALTAGHPYPERMFGDAEWAGWLAARAYARDVGRQPLTVEFILALHRRLAQWTEQDAAGILKLQWNWGLGSLAYPLTDEQRAAIAENPNLSYLSAEEVARFTGRPIDPLSPGGAIHYRAVPDQEGTYNLLRVLCVWFNVELAAGRDPTELAVELEQRFVSIHPFYYDYNGRVARLLMNWVLESHGLFPSAVADFDNDLLTRLRVWIQQVREGCVHYGELFARAHRPGAAGPISVFELEYEHARYPELDNPPSLTAGIWHDPVEFDQFLARLRAPGADQLADAAVPVGDRPTSAAPGSNEQAEQPKQPRAPGDKSDGPVSAESHVGLGSEVSQS